MKKLRQLRFSAKHRMKTAGWSNVGLDARLLTKQYGNACQSIGQFRFLK